MLNVLLLGMYGTLIGFAFSVFVKLINNLVLTDLTSTKSDFLPLPDPAICGSRIKRLIGWLMAVVSRSRRSFVFGWRIREFSRLDTSLPFRQQMVLRGVGTGAQSLVFSLGLPVENRAEVAIAVFGLNEISSEFDALVFTSQSEEPSDPAETAAESDSAAREPLKGAVFSVQTQKAEVTDMTVKSNGTTVAFLKTDGSMRLSFSNAKGMTGVKLKKGGELQQAERSKTPVPCQLDLFFTPTQQYVPDRDRDNTTFAMMRAREPWTRDFFDDEIRLKQSTGEVVGKVSGTIRVRDTVVKIEWSAVVSHQCGSFSWHHVDNAVRQNMFWEDGTVWSSAVSSEYVWEDTLAGYATQAGGLRPVTGASTCHALAARFNGQMPSPYTFNVQYKNDNKPTEVKCVAQRAVKFVWGGGLAEIVEGAGTCSADERTGTLMYSFRRFAGSSNEAMREARQSRRVHHSRSHSDIEEELERLQREENEQNERRAASAAAPGSQ